MNSILKYYANRILKKFNPKVILVTGNKDLEVAVEAMSLMFPVGKVSKKIVRSDKVDIELMSLIINKESIKNTGFKEIIDARAILSSGSYPEYLILGYEIKKPNVLRELVKFLNPDLFIVTGVDSAFSSVSGFQNSNEYVKEHFPVDLLKENASFVFNQDDDLVCEHVGRYQGKIKTISFGSHSNANVKLENSELMIRNSTNQFGVNAKISHKGVITPMFISNHLNANDLSPILAAMSVGIVFDINLVKISENLSGYSGVNGHNKLEKGINQSILLDSSKNNSFEDIIESIKIFGNTSKFFERNGDKRRRIIIFKDQGALDKSNQKSYKAIGSEIAKIVDKTILIGEDVEYIKSILLENKVADEKISVFNDQEEYVSLLPNEIEEKDYILITGTDQGLTTEIVKVLSR